MSTQLAQIYNDFAGLGALRSQAREDQEAALDEVTRQFESLFMQMMLKSMRQASFGGGLLDSKQSEFYRDMYDQQMSVELSKQHGLGLADVLKRQLGGAGTEAANGLKLDDYMGQPVTRATALRQASAAPESADSSERAVKLAGREALPDVGEKNHKADFLQQLWPEAQEAAKALNLDPKALIAQAALETGWGRHVIRDNTGSSHNLFGIKADQRWSGDKVRVSTLEYKQGVALKTRADFRAYGSYAESFRDYVAFIQESPRYRKALLVSADSQAYFRELQRAGYATDPDYAKKIGRILDSQTLQTAGGNSSPTGAG